MFIKYIKMNLKNSNLLFLPNRDSYIFLLIYNDKESAVIRIVPWKVFIDSDYMPNAL